MIELNGRYFMIHDFEHEIWKIIPGYPNYMISNFSRIKTINSSKAKILIMTPFINYQRTNDIQIQLTKNGKQYKIKIEKLLKDANFKHVIRIKLHDEQYVKYDKNAEYIYNAF